MNEMGSHWEGFEWSHLNCLLKDPLVAGLITDHSRKRAEAWRLVRGTVAFILVRDHTGLDQDSSEKAVRI